MHFLTVCIFQGGADIKSCNHAIFSDVTGDCFMVIFFTDVTAEKLNIELPSPKISLALTALQATL
jgi:hypothetical protein